MWNALAWGWWACVPLAWALAASCVFLPAALEGRTDWQLLGTTVSGIFWPCAFMAAAHVLPGSSWLVMPGLWLIGTIVYLGKNGGRFFNRRSGAASLTALLLLLYAVPSIAAMCLVRWLS